MSDDLSPQAVKNILLSMQLARLLYSLPHLPIPFFCMLIRLHSRSLRILLLDLQFQVLPMPIISLMPLLGRQCLL
jgi:hypothetical protein